MAKKDFLSGSSFTNIDIATMEKAAGVGTIIWNTENVNKLISDYADGTLDIRGFKGSPFLNNDINSRKPRLLYQYTKDEMNELRRCKKDVIYFGEKYCKLFTEHGYVSVKFRDYQNEILDSFIKHDHVVLMAARQVGKCFIFSTLITIKFKNTGDICEVPFFELYYNVLKQTRKLNMYEKIKWKLYALHSYLSSGHDYIIKRNELCRVLANLGN